MCGKIENFLALIKRMLGSIAMMQIPVYDHHSFEAKNLYCIMGGNGHIVKQTKAHRLVSFRMMTRRAHQSKTIINLTTH